ncbi:MAG: hypothetical protein AUJ96_10405 [Armatimonadetes bacterium CG2_30_66_41]|nr:sugar phosphate isomerase/epimerase [Armatimonadota bacterium]OIP05696.1 MAG: hypothetical protein AUJ96_10405 [Armatimonadetes bacterium CG2_30_66_41]NCO93681.1 sugar phosphate isomerase/epimerase [Armatimonadota bacterium]NCP28570.1 sugar phosphate isomerase/epimerase [Armatimonadota bacterium]NCQ30260.1 sugar phosphate isomerase/epimerase [Armatimonadota bacterium]
MKLSLLTFNIARDMPLEEVIRVAKETGFAAIEFRAEANHAHGVEPSLSAEERQQVRRKMEDAYLATSCIGTSSRFESPDPEARKQMVEHTKQFVELASDLHCGRVRVFGNDLPKGVDSADCTKYVGDCLRELGEHAEPLGVDVLLEMHGQFNFWQYTLAAVEHAAHPRVDIVYNCDPRDVIAGSIAETYSHVWDRIRHIHLHELDSSYPYKELFGLLRTDGYDGYLSSEIEGSTDPERVLGLYSALFYAWARG